LTFRVHSASGDQWTIIDERDQVVFVGTKRQCEDWLDCHENAQPRPSFLKAWIRALFGGWRTLPVHRKINKTNE
jgi:hypothetical protein